MQILSVSGFFFILFVLEHTGTDKMYLGIKQT